MVDGVDLDSHIVAAQEGFPADAHTPHPGEQSRLKAIHRRLSPGERPEVSVVIGPRSIHS